MARSSAFVRALVLTPVLVAACSSEPSSGSSPATGDVDAGLDGGAPDAREGGGDASPGATDAGAADAGDGGKDADAAAKSALAGPCETDADCSAGLTCSLTEGLGYKQCTSACTSDDQCKALAPTSWCTAQSKCLRNCTTDGDCPSGTECFGTYCMRTDRTKCVGTALACENQPDCQSVRGCAGCNGQCDPSWDALTCFSRGCSPGGRCVAGVGTPMGNCATATLPDTCKFMVGCTWEGATCTAGPSALCTAATSNAECTARTWCTLSPCVGTPSACKTLDIAKCPSVAGCTVQAGAPGL